MSEDVFEDENIILTKFCGPEGQRRGYQITSKKSETMEVNNQGRTYVSTVLEDKT